MQFDTEWQQDVMVSVHGGQAVIGAVGLDGSLVSLTDGDEAIGGNTSARSLLGSSISLRSAEDVMLSTDGNHRVAITGNAGSGVLVSTVGDTVMHSKRMSMDVGWNQYLSTTMRGGQVTASA